MNNWKEKKLFSLYDNENKYRSRSLIHTPTNFQIDILSLEGSKKAFIITVYNPNFKNVSGFEEDNKIQLVGRNKKEKEIIVNEIKKDIETLKPKNMLFTKKYYSMFKDNIVESKNIDAELYDIL